jgi:hypothetical protein
MPTLHDAKTHGKIRLDHIPYKLRSYRQFVVWRYEDHGEPKLRKVPKNPRTGNRASVSNPASWGTLAEALAAYNAEDYSGIGFVFTTNDNFAGIDLDKCRNPETGEVEPWAREIMQRVGGWWEISPSGTGLHAIVEMSAPLPKPGSKKPHIEIYESGRYFTLTGNHVEETERDITDCTSEVLAFHKQVFGEAEQPPANPRPAPIVNLSDAKLLRAAARAKNGDKFSRLMKGDTTGYPSHSEADLALCILLAFFTGNDAERIDRLFRQSGLYRDKWENRPDYRDKTIKAALRSTRGAYGTTEKPEARAAINALLSIVATFPWKGTVGSSAKLVLTALSQLIEQTGKEDSVSADCRTIAEMTGLSFATAARTFRRLCGVAGDKRDDIPVCLARIVDKTILCTDGRASRHAYKYRLKEALTQSLTPLEEGELDCVKELPLDLATISDNAFRKRGYGLTRSAGLVCEALPAANSQELAKRTHLSLGTVRKALASLKAENVAKKDEITGVWIRTTQSLDAVARRRGTPTASEDQKRLHARQRANYSAWLRPRVRKIGDVYRLAQEWREAA